MYIYECILHKTPTMRFSVQGLGFRTLGLGFRVRAQDLGFRVVLQRLFRIHDAMSVVGLGLGISCWSFSLSVLRIGCVRVRVKWWGS